MDLMPTISSWQMGGLCAYPSNVCTDQSKALQLWEIKSSQYLRHPQFSTNFSRRWHYPHPVHTRANASYHFHLHLPEELLLWHIMQHYHAMYNTLNKWINNAFKVAPSTTPPTTGWNASMLLNDILIRLWRCTATQHWTPCVKIWWYFCPLTTLRIRMKSCSNYATTVKSCHHC